jgi:26 proteasome complex subunit DSS1
MADNKKKENEKVPTLVIVTEEDDEFEEFEVADWNPQAEEKENHIKQQWQDDWDVDEADDDFCNQLRNELKKSN